MTDKREQVLFYSLTSISLISLGLIVVNAWMDLAIPFTVDFLIAFVGAMLIFVIWHAVLTKGWNRTLLMISLSFFVAFTAEALGVNFGLIFGKYHYTGLLGFQVFGVPLLAALAWEPVIYAAFCLTDILAPSIIRPSNTWASRVLAYLLMSGIAALATTAWDMMIDPIAVSQGWWVWQQGGEYLPYVANGVPIQNFMGWLGVSFFINFLFRMISNGNPERRSSLHLSINVPIALYAALFLTSFGVSITVIKRPEVALIGMLVMGPFLAIALTNVNLIRQGLGTLLGSGWLELETKKGG